MSPQTQSSIKEEEMDTEQDMNGEIKMSGEKMKEENTMTDKKASDRSRQQIILAAVAAAARVGRSIFARFVQSDDAGNKRG